MTSSPTTAYAEITKAVTQIVSEYSGNDRSRAAYLTMRAAALILRDERGPTEAGLKLDALSDELAGCS